MYLLFKNVDAKSVANVQVIGYWNSYAIGYVPDTHVDILEYRHLKPRIIDEAVAKTWMFFGSHRGHISVRSGTAQNEQLQLLSSHEATGEKTKYYMTDEDKANTTKLMQEVLRCMLDDIFDKRFVQLNVGASELETTSWAQQRAELDAFKAGGSAPLLQALADARDISLEEMAAKVEAGIQAHADKVTALMARKQQIEQEIKACESVGDCNRLMHNRFELEMPVYQKEEEGIEYNSKFDI